MKKYEYRVCACGCSFCFNLIIDLANKTVLVKESTVPPVHVNTGDRITSSQIHITKELLGYIDFLAEHNLITSAINCALALAMASSQSSHSFWAR
jgi:hypothetical protein